VVVGGGAVAVLWWWQVWICEGAMGNGAGVKSRGDGFRLPSSGDESGLIEGLDRISESLCNPVDVSSRCSEGDLV
jgi:hypothetical protein